MRRSSSLAALHEQALDPRHPVLRSSGRLGLLLGLGGTALIFLDLTCLVRWPRLGALRSWMDFHVASGILGPA